MSELTGALVATNLVTTLDTIHETTVVEVKSDVLAPQYTQQYTMVDAPTVKVKAVDVVSTLSPTVTIEFISATNIDNHTVNVTNVVLNDSTYEDFGSWVIKNQNPIGCSLVTDVNIEFVSNTSIPTEVLYLKPVFQESRFYIDKVNPKLGIGGTLDTDIHVIDVFIGKYHVTTKVLGNFVHNESYLDRSTEFANRLYLDSVVPHQNIDFVSEDHLCHHAFQNNLYENDNGYYTIAPNGLIKYTYALDNEDFTAKYRELYVQEYNAKLGAYDSIHLSDNIYIEAASLNKVNFEKELKEYAHSTEHFNANTKVVSLDSKGIYSV